MREVFAAMLEALEKGRAVVRASVMKSSGSTPRTSGASMAVFADGSIVGTIGGGKVENASIKAALKVMDGCQSQVREFDLTGKDAADLGMVCGGDMTVLLDCYSPGDTSVSLLRDILRVFDSGETNVLISVLSSDNQVVLRGISPLDADVADSLPEIEIPKQIRTPLLREFDGGILFAEPLDSGLTVRFIGAGHVARAAAHLAAFTGFQVMVTDDRKDFANAERFPEAREVRVVESLKSCLPDVLGPKDCVVIMTRGHLHDRDVLAQALSTDAGYIGMIGSTRKRESVYKSLLSDGFTQSDLDRVHCPIGLAIDADTPEEIAVSIIAELIQFRAGRR